ncbi:DUF3943 domain-containing protein [Colwellia sp. RSH04]|uniref:DUF3943 domain-containing protein n=1 Tax=Colwellia sp. RSH04 TaxID=2305464 RepID=UPI000E57363A|nr:DUF3943 domain-containing protein [Colwellia sp. RSH04]
MNVFKPNNKKNNFLTKYAKSCLCFVAVSSSFNTHANSTPVELKPAISTENIEEVYKKSITNTSWENLTPNEDFYQSPYKMSLFNPKSGEDGARLWSQTSSIFAYGFGVIGLIALLPEDISNWDKEEGIFNKWSDNVKEGPVWDRDTGMLNFVGHPYFGGVYYQVARKSGYRQWDAFLYSTLMSTFYWEYGIESFAEVPSIQDLVITPVLGWAYGEWAYNTEMDIREDGGTIWGSSALGSTVLAILDPVDSLSVGVNNLFGREIIRAGTGFVSFNEVPVDDIGNTENQIKLNISLQLGEGGTYSGNHKTYKRVNDPVDTGIIGMSYGVGHIELDESWMIEGGTTTEYTLGLYFSKQFSSRVSYSKAQLTEIQTNQPIAYESYRLNGQYYFNTESNFRPYITAGFGEIMWKKDNDYKKLQLNGGIGMHYKINNNFAIQADWRHHYSTNAKTSENAFATNLIYFFGTGER